MERAKAAMGFRSVKRVEIKAETTTPGEVRTTTDANGLRVSTTRARRTLPKLEFVVEENGAVLHGPQRTLFPYYAPPSSSFGGGGGGGGGDVPAPGNQAEAEIVGDLAPHDDYYPSHPQPMKDCVLNDTRATTLAVRYDPALGKYVCGSSIERFSGHTGVCRVLGSKKYPIIPHALQLGDLLRIGSVGLVVCELNRGPSEDCLEALTEEEYEYIRENYLSVPLQQTFRPAEVRSGGGERSNNHDECDDDEDEDHDEGGGEEEEEEEEERTPGGGDRPLKMRSGETSDEGESEEDGVKQSDNDASDEDDGGEHSSSNNNSSVHSHPQAKKKRAKTQRATAGSSSKEKKFCYICYDTDDEPDENPLVAPCNCKGDTKHVHLECLQRWNNNLDGDSASASQKLCAVTNTDGLDVCSICKATYLTSVKLDDGRVVSLMAKKLPPPYVTFAVVTQHEARSRSTTLTNTRFQLSFANIPRGQQFLTIGRSTTNNMTLRYRTVSQLHAKVKFEDNNFYIYDASSSNGTMLFLNRPLELEWNQTAHVKIGRTILTLKSKKRWKWTGGGDGEEEAAVASPREADSPSSNNNNNNNQQAEPESYLPSHRFDSRVSSIAGGGDPSAELLASPFGRPLPHHPSINTSTMNEFDFDRLRRLSDTVDDGASVYPRYLARRPLQDSSIDAADSLAPPPPTTSVFRRLSTMQDRVDRGEALAPRAYPHLPADVVAGTSIPLLAPNSLRRYVYQNGVITRRPRPTRELVEQLAQLSVASPRIATDRLSAPGSLDRAS